MSLSKWLNEEPKGGEVGSLIAKFLLIQFAYAMIVAIVLGLLGVFPSGREEVLDPNLKHGSMFFLLIISAFGEESVFRFLPMVVAVRWMKLSLTTTLVIALFVSIIFGMGHGGPAFILLQGVLGFMWCLMFLKCGGLQGRPYKAIMVTTTSHFLYNATLTLIIMFSNPSVEVGLSGLFSI